jgi:quinol---cytochrome c reductase iron-sulfur subunit, bacillus type
VARRRHRPRGLLRRESIDSGAQPFELLTDEADKQNGAQGPGRQERAKPDPPGYFEGESMTRRHAFTIAVQGLGGLAGAAIVLPAVGFAVAPIFHRGKERWEAVGKVDDFVAATYRQVVFTETEGIGDAGKTTAYVRKGSKQLSENPKAFIAVSNRCAHLGCPVRFVEAAGNFICPCHGGVYDFQGKRIGGPPVRPLDHFQTRVRDGQVELGPRYSVTNQLEPVRARDPGEFTGGVWEYLYPPRPSTFPPP